MGDSLCSGNYGLWDQRLAILGVKDNIITFGGNPESITLFGESAGGVSVALHSISPVNKGLFTRAISQSGVMFSTWGLKGQPLVAAIEVGKNLSCIGEEVNTTHVNKSLLLDYIRSKPVIDIFNAAYN